MGHCGRIAWIKMIKRCAKPLSTCCGYRGYSGLWKVETLNCSSILSIILQTSRRTRNVVITAFILQNFDIPFPCGAWASANFERSRLTTFARINYHCKETNLVAFLLQLILPRYYGSPYWFRIWSESPQPQARQSWKNLPSNVQVFHRL